MADCDRLVKKVLDEHGHVDVLINNAARSIRRSIEASYDRFHDFERTMQLNYFGSIRLIMGSMPTLPHRRMGHIITIRPIRVRGNSPRFSRYGDAEAHGGAGRRSGRGGVWGNTT